ncbi:MAG: hypothetical protein IPG71_07885 [bacterium]|nr:hypothetical protein [bacterium]
MPRTKRVRAIFRPERGPGGRMRGQVGADVRRRLYSNFASNATQLMLRSPAVRDYIVWGQAGLLGDCDSLDEAFLLGYAKAGRAKFIVQEKDDLEIIMQKKRRARVL